ncbi:DUF366 family protein [bacterium]|nr:DUF366 family protein [bacterium]
MKAVNLNRMDYDGSQLHHAFAYEQAKVLGATICYFRGSANVKEHLVDLEDSLVNDFIKSKEMWHFIIEIPGATITEMVIWQRLFISMCIDNLRESHGPTIIITRKGDDIMIRDRKLSVSIATLSRFSGLIHVGINIEVGEGCPVDAIGLLDLNGRGYSSIFGRGMAFAFVEEYNDIKNATFKVIEV